MSRERIREDTEERFPGAPTHLVDEGAAWAREKFLFEKSKDIKGFLETAFVGSLGIFNVHRVRIMEKVEAEGGVASLEVARPWSEGPTGHNRIITEAGSSIYASELLTTRVVEIPLPTTGLPPGTEQTYALVVSYGGTSVGLKAEEALDYDIDRKGLNRRLLEGFFRPDFSPEDVCLTEQVITTRDGERLMPADHRAVSQEHYSLSVSSWMAKLRECFAPDPWLHPKEYRRWAESAPVEVRDMIFTATGEIINPRETWKKYKGMKTYVKSGRIEEPDEAVQKLARYYELLNFAHNKMTGMDIIGQTGVELVASSGLALPAPVK